MPNFFENVVGWLEDTFAPIITAVKQLASNFFGSLSDAAVQELGAQLPTFLKIVGDLVASVEAPGVPGQSKFDSVLSQATSQLEQAGIKASTNLLRLTVEGMVLKMNQAKKATPAPDAGNPPAPQ